MAVTIYKDKTGRNSMKRLIAYVGFILLCAAFGLMAWKGKLTDNMFLTFPLGAVVFYAPQLAVTLLKIWKGQYGPAAPVGKPEDRGDI